MSLQERRGYPLPPGEEERLAALEAYGILDTAPETVYDDLTRLAARAVGVGRAAVHFIDEHRQWAKASRGPSDYTGPRAESFCTHTICEPAGVMVVEDAREDPRFQGNQLVHADPPLIFYAGVAITSPAGHRLGTLCVFGDEPSKLSPEDQSTLEALARQVTALLDCRTECA